MNILTFTIMLILDAIIILPIALIIKSVNKKINKIRKEREEQELKQRMEEYDYLAKQIALEQALIFNQDSPVSPQEETAEKN